MSNWDELRLGLAVNIKKGKITTQSEIRAKGLLPLINTEALVGDAKLFADPKDGIVCEYTDVLMLWDGERSGLVATEQVGVVGSTFARLRPESGIDSKYLFYFLQDKYQWIQNNRTGTGVPHVAKDLGKILLIRYPEYPIQQKIAKILSTIDGQIEKTKAIIAKYQAVKQGMLQDLFTRGIDVTTGELRPKYEDAPELYKDSVLGMVPREWDCLPLEQITTHVDYRGKTPPKSELGVFLVTAKNVKFGYIDYDNSQEYIPAKAYDIVMSRGLPEIGDVLFTTEAPMGNVAQIERSDVALAQRVIKFRGIKNVVTNDFLRISLMAEYFQRMLTMEASGSTVLGIKGSRLHKLKLYVPKLMEQDAISNFTNVIVAKTRTESSMLAKYQQIKNGLMSDLLSGKVEVTA